VKILFLIIGPVSFNNSCFVRNFLKQIDQEENKITVIAEEYTLQYLHPDKRFINYFKIEKSFDRKNWKNILEKNEPDLLIISNLEFLLFDEKISLFKKNYLSDIDVPTMFFSVNSTVVYKPNGAYLKAKPQEKIDFNFPAMVLKVCPPNIPDDNTEITTYYWKNTEPFAFLGKEEERMHLRSSLKASEEELFVSLIFDLESVINAVNKGLFFHYKVLLKLLVSYLGRIEAKIRLLVGNIASFDTGKLPENVKVNFFGPLIDDIQEKILKSTDLLITESISGATLIEAANLKIPVINLKSSIYFDYQEDENGDEVSDLVFNFSELTENAENKLEELLRECPNAIFPYYSFPNVASVNFNEEKVFGLYIFNFAELFAENKTVKLIKELLIDFESRKAEIYRIEQYLALRSEAMDAGEIIEYLLSEEK